MNDFIFDAVVAELLRFNLRVREAQEQPGYFWLFDISSPDGAALNPEPWDRRQLQTFYIHKEQLSLNPSWKMFHFYFYGGSYACQVAASFEEAAKKAGIGAGAFNAIDFTSEGQFPLAKFNFLQKKWVLLSQPQVFS